MKYFHYLVLLLLLVIIHLFLFSYAMIFTWFLLGALLAVFIRNDRWLMLNVLFLEWLTGIGFSIFSWNNSHQLSNLAENTSIAGISWVAMIIAIQSITAFLCIASTYCIVRRWQRVRKM